MLDHPAYLCTTSIMWYQWATLEHCIWSGEQIIKALSQTQALLHLQSLAATLWTRTITDHSTRQSKAYQDSKRSPICWPPGKGRNLSRQDSWLLSWTLTSCDWCRKFLLTASYPTGILRTRLEFIVSSHHDKDSGSVKMEAHQAVQIHRTFRCYQCLSHWDEAVSQMKITTVGNFEVSEHLRLIHLTIPIWRSSMACFNLFRSCCTVSTHPCCGWQANDCSESLHGKGFAIRWGFNCTTIHRKLSLFCLDQNVV